MGISLPVGSHLDESQARRTANRAEDVFSAAGRQAGDAFSRNVNQGIGRVDTAGARVKAEQLQRAYDKAADAAGKLRAEEAKLDAVQASGTATRAQLITHTERVERARRAEARAVREATSAYRDAESASRLAMTAGEGIASAAAQAGQSMTAMGSAAANAMSELGGSAASAAGSVSKLGSALGPIAGGVGIGSAIVAGATAVTLAIGAIGGSIAELSGSIGLLPGLGAAGAAAFGTLTLATQGFSDALGDIRDSKKFAEDLKDLSPNAQQAATAIQQLMPMFDGLRVATQDSLFAGVGQQLEQLSSTYLPAVQQMTTTIAGAFNQMFDGITAQLMTPETQGAIQAAMSNIGQAFQNLVPAIGPVTKAIADLANVSSGFLPGLATAIANAATQFSNFLSNAAQTGELRQWIQDGVDALKEIVSLGPDLKQMFVDFKANGNTAISDVVGLIRAAIKIVDELGGAYSRVSGSVKAMANIVAASFGMIEKSISMSLEPLRAMIDLNNKLNPVFKIDQIPRFGDITTPFPDAGVNPFAPRVQGRATAEPLVGQAPSGSGGLGAAAGLPLATAPVNPFFMQDKASGGGGSKKTPLPTVAYSGDPMSLLQGFPATASLYSAAGTVLDNQQKVAQAQSDLNTLEKANVRDEDAIIAKRNELARAAREEHESELRLNEAKQQAVQKTLKGMQSTAGDLQQLGAQIDKDFGISKGLGGIVENAVKAVGNIVAAPFLQALGFVAKANPNEGSGLVGIMAANGAFGSQYTPGAIAMMQASQRSGGGGYPGGYAPVAAAVGGGQPYGLPNGTDIRQGAPGFPSWVYQVANAFGLQASTYVGHQEDKGQGNQGIDWWGPVENRQRFAEWLAQNRGMPGLEDVIFENPNTGQDIGVNNGRLVGTPGSADPGYFRRGKNDFADHRDHVHTTQSESLGLPGAPQATDSLNGLASAANSAANALGGPGGGWNADWNTFTPGSAGPPAPGGGPMYPGIGPSQALPGMSPLGPVTPAVGGGTAYPSQGGNSGNILGGLAMDGIMAATSGLDILAPGAGAAAKIGIQVANRTIGYAAQNAGILANGIGEFFSVGDNPKGSIGAGWFGKIAGGLAGAGAALPNIAGQKAPQQQGNGQQQGGNTNNVNNTINVQAREGASGQEHGEQVAAETSRMYAPAGRQ